VEYSLHHWRSLLFKFQINNINLLMEQKPQATSLSIEPETSQITDPVTITLGLSQPALLEWTLTYVVDSAGSKQNIVLNKLKSDAATLKMETPQIDLSGISRHFLLNIGLFKLEGVNSESREVVICKNMLVHVSKDKQNDEILMKTILNPL
jgi:hypothetical protein